MIDIGILISLFATLLGLTPLFILYRLPRQRNDDADSAPSKREDRDTASFAPGR